MSLSLAGCGVCGDSVCLCHLQAVVFVVTVCLCHLQAVGFVVIVCVFVTCRL